MIFYKKKDNKDKINNNKHNNAFQEVDKIVLVDEDAKISNFMAYLKREFK